MIFWSLKGRKNFGRCYWDPHFGSVFLNQIYKHSDSFFQFFYRVWYVYFHEYLHLFFRHELGKYSCSEKTVIEPLARRLVNAVFIRADERSFIVDCMIDWNLEVEEPFIREREKK